MIFSKEQVAEACRTLHIGDLSSATIGEMVLVAQYLENKTGIPFIRMDQGSPSLPMNKYGIETEIAALKSGIGSQYPPAGGVPELRKAASRFIKAFIDIDLDSSGCIATTGSVAASFGAFIGCTQRIPGKDKVLFIDPGFPIQKSQLRVLGIGWYEFDIYAYRGAEKLSAKLEEELSRGDIGAIIYSNPNNPAWICLDESELKVIGDLATKYDAVVMEDLAYFCMDFRHKLGRPYQPPFVPTVARYTDNYILMLSASKIFSYAGQRIALCCIGNELYRRRYPAMAERYGDAGIFGSTLKASILYMITSGCTATTQYAYAKMLDLSCDGVINFVEDIREYERRAARMKEIFCRHGFTITYDWDVDEPVGDGFFFSLSYPGMTSGELVKELVCYGVSSISLSTTGSRREGVRACTSRMPDDMYGELEERMRQFQSEHTSN
ncbi:MAG: pyridoxal phosphate-dependent aminotransferase [Bacteroidales bacterium]|nr:pyridoxal phosphate-dependent aminotransferase [Bacteroidales bacterium]